MNFYSNFFNIHMKEKGLTSHDYYGLKWKLKNKCLVLIDYV